MFLLLKNKSKAIILSYCSSLASLLFGFALEHVKGVHPCILCQYQRIAIYFIMIISMIGVITNKIREKTILILIAIFFITNLAIASYHVAIEHKLIQEPGGCTDKLSNAKITNINDLKIMLEKQSGNKGCSEVPYRIFSFSLAESNVIFSLIFIFIIARELIPQLMGKNEVKG